MASFLSHASVNRATSFDGKAQSHLRNSLVNGYDGAQAPLNWAAIVAAEDPE
jgi:hypothetical protein